MRRFKLNDPEVEEIIDSADNPRLIQPAVQTILTRRLTEALGAHANALRKAAESSSTHARRLVWATWALVGATLAMVLSIAAQIWISID